MKILKTGATAAAEISEEVMDKINRLTLRELTPDDVFTFRVIACDDQADRDFERFTPECLEGLAPMFVGRSVLFDHDWTAVGQTARIFDADVAQDGDIHQLILSCYMIRAGSAQIIDLICGGILKEVSVGCAVGRRSCSICGKSTCRHDRGADYDGKTCVMELSDPVDAYELSFVSVPSQPRAGVIKRYGGDLADETRINNCAWLMFQAEKWRS